MIDMGGMPPAPRPEDDPGRTVGTHIDWWWLGGGALFAVCCLVALAAIIGSAPARAESPSMDVARSRDGQGRAPSDAGIASSIEGDPYQPAQQTPARTTCVTCCPAVVCQRVACTSESWELRVVMNDGTVHTGVGGCFGRWADVDCYCSMHINQKGVHVILPAEDEACDPHVASCSKWIAPDEILACYGVRVQ